MGRLFVFRRGSNLVLLSTGEAASSGIPPRQVPPQAAVALLKTRRGLRLASLAARTPPTQKCIAYGSHFWGVVGRTRRGSHPHSGKKTDPLTRIGLFGASSGIRTPDTLLKRQVLCRLS